jgi:hypothetical protein
MNKKLFLMLGLAGGALVASPACARERMTDEQMDSHRAGFVTPTGLEVHLGAEVRTFVDGQLALQTRLSWTEAGVTREVVTGQQTPEAAARLGFDLTNVEWSGLVIERPDGVAAALSHVSDSRIANVLVNTASDQDIRLETELTLHVPDLENFQNEVLLEQTSQNIHDAIGQALQGF